MHSKSRSGEPRLFGMHQNGPTRSYYMIMRIAVRPPLYILEGDSENDTDIGSDSGGGGS